LVFELKPDSLKKLGLRIVTGQLPGGRKRAHRAFTIRGGTSSPPTRRKENEHEI